MVQNTNIAILEIDRLTNLIYLHIADTKLKFTNATPLIKLKYLFMQDSSVSLIKTSGLS